MKLLDLFWWARRDLNPQPRDYESPALTVELQARIFQQPLYRVEITPIVMLSFETPLLRWYRAWLSETRAHLPRNFFERLRETQI